MELYNKYFYFLLLLFSFSFPFVRSFENKLNYYKKWPALLSGIVLMIVIHIPIDIYFTNIGVWSFNKEFVCGAYLANLPIEEWLFFLIIPFCCVFIYECTNYFFSPKKPSLTNYKITFFCGIVFIILACLLNEKAYTSLYFSLAGVSLVLIYLLQPGWWYKFQVMYFFVLIPFTLVNGFLTGSFTEDAVVYYNDLENLSIRVLNIPIEDFVYNFNILLLVVAVYEYQLTKMLSVKKN